MRLPRKIYAIKHNATNRVYVGSSCNVEKRIKSHLSALRGHRHIVEDMQTDFDRYGENYTITILEEIRKFEDRIKEYEWMHKLHSHIRGKGYNYKDHIVNREKKSKNECELISIIRSSENPHTALIIAIETITKFLDGDTEE